jgi:hypothetical protein
MRSRQSETLRLFILAAILAALALWSLNHWRRRYSRISRVASRMASINGFQPPARTGPRWR